MSYKMNKAQSTLKSYFRGKNFMTPEVVEYGQIDGLRAYELSKGDWQGSDIFGVTVVRKLNGKPAEPIRDQSQMFHSEAEARAHIEALK